jgi:hypothetical protein
MIFLNVLSCHATPGCATEQYCHASGSSVTAFSTSEIPFIVADNDATTLFGCASTAGESDLKIFF